MRKKANKNPGFALLFMLILPSLIIQSFAVARGETAPEGRLFDAQIAVTSLSGDDLMFYSPTRMKAVITAYSSTHDQTDSTPFITASGKRVRDGIIAANFLKFGVRIQIPEIFGDKIFVVEDRMARRFSNRVDIWFPDRGTALKFGKQEAEIIIL